MMAAGIVDIQHLVTELDPLPVKSLALDQDVGIDRFEALHILAEDVTTVIDGTLQVAEPV